MTSQSPIVSTVGVAGHVGELLQGRLGPAGPVVLITLPCPVLRVTASLMPGPDFQLDGAPILPRHRAVRLLGMLECRLAGRITLKSEMPPGGGAGSSTAALVALARLAGIDDPASIARAAIAVEGAVDPLMWPDPARHLWASRRAQSLCHLPALPAMTVAAGFHGAAQLTEPADHRFPDISDLIQDWPSACGDPASVAALATQSAIRSLALRGKPHAFLSSLAARLGALGFAVAHTGSAVAFLFRSQSAPTGTAAFMAAAGIAQPMVFDLA